MHEIRIFVYDNIRPLTPIELDWISQQLRTPEPNEQDLESPRAMVRPELRQEIIAARLDNIAFADEGVVLEIWCRTAGGRSVRVEKLFAFSSHSIYSPPLAA